MGGFGKAVLRRGARRLPRPVRRRLARALPRQARAALRRQRADAVLVSFPKCGRTWLRLLLGRALQQHYGLPADANLLELGRLAELDPRVPDVLVTHDDDAQWKSAAEVERDKGAYAGRRVVLLVRDPRDVIVSLYYQKRFRRDADVGSLASYVEGPDFDALLAFSDAWAAQLDVPAAVLVVRYEDLHADPAAELRRVLAFLGVPDVPDAVVAEAVAYASFDNMRRLEETDAFGSDKLRPAQAGRTESYKTRRGRVGGFRDELTAAQVARLDDRMAASRVATFGYGSSSP